MTSTSIPNIQQVLVKETIIASIINATLSFLFFFFAFKGQDIIPLGKGAKFAFDFLPQAFAVGFFAAFPVLLITSLKIKKGKLQGTAKTFVPIFLRSIIMGLVSFVIIGGGLCLLTQMLGSTALSFSTAAIIKVITGIIITIIVTPIALKSLVK